VEHREDLLPRGKAKAKAGAVVTAVAEEVVEAVVVTAVAEEATVEVVVEVDAAVATAVVAEEAEGESNSGRG